MPLIPLVLGGGKLGGSISGITHEIGSALGLGPSTADRRHKSYVDVHKKIRAENWPALVDAALNSKWLGARWEAVYALVNQSNDANAAELARRAAGIPQDVHPSENLPVLKQLVDTVHLLVASNPQWQNGNGTAPPVGSSSPVAPMPTSAPSAPRAPKPLPPCKYGLRVPDGKGGSRCPKKAEVVSGAGGGAAPLAGGKRPCKYGPRDADGHCPPKPRGLTKKTSKTLSQLQRRAVTTAERVVAGGLTGAARAIKAGLKGSGISAGAAAATTAAVVLAAAVGWFIGQAITHDGDTKAQRKAFAAVDLVHARKAMEKELGVGDGGLTKAQYKPLWDEYQRRLKLIDSGLDNSSVPSIYE